MPTPNKQATALALRAEIKLRGGEILRSEGILASRKFIQHGDVSVYEHCVNVAFLSLYLARRFDLNLDRRSLVRGALLHDYFLYDWHEDDPSHRLHGFHHARRALENACRDFPLNEREKDIIARHMFPLNLRPPKYKESILVCAADKCCALLETFGVEKLRELTKVHSYGKSTL